MPSANDMNESHNKMLSQVLLPLLEDALKKVFGEDEVTFNLVVQSKRGGLLNVHTASNTKDPYPTMISAATLANHVSNMSSMPMDKVFECLREVLDLKETSVEL